MADSLTTKRAFAGALKKLMVEKSFEKVSIGEICDACDMNRKSFYYHFHDKYELVIWIFKNEFLDRAKTRPEDSAWDTLSRLARYFYANKIFYRRILTVSGQNSFIEYFSSLCRDVFTKKIQEQLGNIMITDLNIKIYSDFFVFAIYSWLTSPDNRDDRAFVRDTRNSVVFGAELAKRFADSDIKR